jgi:histidine triad (HIT) family protein
MTDCIFCKIVEGTIPSRKLYEDDDMLAFHDIHPLAPVHFMMIPKQHVDSLATATDAHARVLGHMMAMAGRLAKQAGAAEGFRTIVNTGRVGRQDVYHLHIHIIGGPDPLPRMISKE